MLQEGVQFLIEAELKTECILRAFRLKKFSWSVSKTIIVNHKKLVIECGFITKLPHETIDSQIRKIN